ncbi:MAG: endonuclease/exonuclease/phosphatase family protein [Marmoricola sp.]
MRQKLGMAAFVLLLVAVWGAGFLWVRGDLDPSPGQGAVSATRPSVSAAPSQSSRPSTGPTANPYTGKVTPAEERRQVDVNPVRVRPRPLALPPVVKFTMATFNLLGSSHTRGGGKASRMASGPQRIANAVSILDSHGVSVVGFQEFQPDQRRAFAGRARGWEIYPGDGLGRGDGENSVAWRTDTWELVKPGSIPIPYFNGRVRQMPSVLLRNKETGVQAYFSNFHNPADTGRFRNQGRFRAVATSREITLFNQLESTGIPQFVTGDMNDRAEYFCRVTGSTPLIAAAGGSNNGGCAVPRPTQIDWILGSPKVEFSDYSVDRDALVRRTTDHPVVFTQVTIDALRFKGAYEPKAVTPG